MSTTSTLKSALIKEFHETLLGGHSGILKTFMRLSTSFTWPQMRKDVKQFVTQCQVCQAIKYSTSKPAGLLQPLPIPELVWANISMDFIIGLPCSWGETVIIVVMDRLTKYAHLGSLDTNFTATKVATWFVEIIVKLHGLPKSIISDRDKIFTSNFGNSYFSSVALRCT